MGSSIPGSRSLALGGLALSLASVGACRQAPFDPLDTAPSPQANAEPAPLANVSATTTTNAGSVDSGPAPELLRTDRPALADVPRETTRETGGKEVVRDARELTGYTLQVVLHTGEGAPGPKSGEVNTSAIEAAKRKTEPRLTVDLTPSRARFVLSGGFVVPQGTELRSRSDRYGHFVLWPGESTYRIAEPGALRALLGERRLDVAPLSPSTVVSAGEGFRRLDMVPPPHESRGGVRTRRVDLTTRAAKASLELATLRDSGEGGALVCRLLLDLMNVHPSAAGACTADEVPVHAELRWATQGALVYDVTSIEKRADLPVQDLAGPPSSVSFTSDPPPDPSGEALLSKAELSAMRSAPIDVPPVLQRDAQEPPPESGLVLQNSTDELRVAWLDGVAVAWVAPGGRAWLPSLVRGKYVLQGRTFLGDAWAPPRAIVVPGVADLGSP